MLERKSVKKKIFMSVYDLKPILALKIDSIEKFNKSSD